MKDSNEKTANYSLVVDGREYTFEVTREGNTRCECHTDSVRVMQHEDKNMAMMALLFGDVKAGSRLSNIRSEFATDIKLPDHVSKLIWDG